MTYKLEERRKKDKGSFGRQGMEVATRERNQAKAKPHSGNPNPRRCLVRGRENDLEKKKTHGVDEASRP
jgi:hypothetical protein